MADKSARPHEQEDAPPSAGGGQPSKIAHYSTLQDVSPTLQKVLKKLYTTLTSSGLSGTQHSELPSLTSYGSFEAWFKTPAATALIPPSEHDLRYPISNYYISSSHNTYLSGNQLYGAATGDAYTNVLMRGCRCLEVDVWDGEDDNSSISSSDLEDEAGEKNNLSVRGRQRSSSKLSKFAQMVKDKAQRSRSPAPPGPPTTHKDVASRVQSSLEPSGEYATTKETVLAKLEPRVKHGYTLTKEVPFRAVCHAIKDSAFIATDLPVIVSLEVHCSLDQQETMVEIMRHVFADHLVDPSLADKISAHGVGALPSPDQLRNKILIKVKWATDPNKPEESNNPLEHAQTTDSAVTPATANTLSSHAPTAVVSSPAEKKKAAKIIHTLALLGVYTRAYTFKSFTDPSASLVNHVYSLSEDRVADFHTDPVQGPDLFKHNRNFFMRVFPSGLRVNSSNVEPCFLWRQGAQMVALNWQKLDKGMMLNEGMFAGSNGWVLKPEGFRGISIQHEGEPAQNPARQLLDLSLEVLAAQSLPLPAKEDSPYRDHMKPYVKLQLHVDTHGPPGQGDAAGGRKASTAYDKSRYGALEKRLTDRLNIRESGNDDGKTDEEERKLKRKTKNGKGADADFGGEVVKWTNIHDVVDELSFLRIKIHDDRHLAKDDLIAWACLKLSRLRTGPRVVHLLNARGEPCDGVLLVNIHKTLR